MPVHDLLDRIYAEGNIIQRYASSVPPAQQQRVSANLQRFHELSLELDSGRYPGLSHFLHHIRSIRQHRDGRPDEPTIAHGQSCVNLMTIHASKGLESPVVILADCDNQGGHNNAYTALVDWPAESSKPVRFQLVTAKDNTDEITREVLKQKEQAQKREELNLLYVALTRARQYLLVTGSASKSKSGWYEYIEAAMRSLTTADSDGAYHLATGDYNGADISKEESAETDLEIAVDTRLTKPILNVVATEHMIAPSLRFHASNESFHSAHDNEATRRGTAIHRAIDLMSRVPPLSAEQARQQIRQESELADNDSELDAWMDEACKTVKNRDFEHVFNPSAYQQALNELPVMHQHNKRSVYGIIDRLIINDDNILLIDYKTHQVENEAELESLAETFQNQMQLYRTGVEKLWPGMKIKSGLLFTHSARLIWIDRDV
jgi:ATP-dependent helicase/nuclease subunit A